LAARRPVDNHRGTEAPDPDSEKGETAVRQHECDAMDFVVVDPRPRDYERLARAVADRGGVVRFFSTGYAVLRRRTAAAADCWLINLVLPDMSGLQLYRLLRGSAAGAAVFLVGDEYRRADEVSVICTTGARFLCKPVEPEWFLGDCRSPSPAGSLAQGLPDSRGPPRS